DRRNDLLLAEHVGITHELIDALEQRLVGIEPRGHRRIALKPAAAEQPFALATPILLVVVANGERASHRRRAIVWLRNALDRRQHLVYVSLHAHGRPHRRNPPIGLAANASRSAEVTGRPAFASTRWL